MADEGLGEPDSTEHAQSVDEVARRMATDQLTGLSIEEAAERLDRFGPNELEEPPGPTLWERLRRQFESPLVLVLLGAIAVSILAWAVEGADGVPLDGIVIAVIVALNAALGFQQERTAEDAVARLKRMATPSAVVVRAGRPRTIDVSEIVPGDLVVLGEGDIVPADGRITESNAMAMAEAALTGESQPVRKSAEPVDPEAPLAERTSMGFSGTSVVAGSGQLLVTATGMSTEVGEIAHLLATAKEPPTPLEREMVRVGRSLGQAVLVVSVVVVAAIWWRQGVDSTSEAVDLLLIGVSLAVAAVPEGLPAVLSLVLAIGTRRMATRNAVLKRLAFAETLGSTSVICTDKTGTLTRNEMSMKRLTTRLGSVERHGDGYAPTGAFGPANGGEADTAQLSAATDMLAAAVLASDADVVSDGDVWSAVGDPTEAALVAAAMANGVDVAEVRARSRRVRVVPFDSVRKRMSVLVDLGDEHDDLLLITKGAPEVVLPLCEHEGGDDLLPLDTAARDRWSTEVETFGDEALRTLAVATRRVSRAEHEAADMTADDETDLSIVGVVGLVDPPRPEAAMAVSSARGAGIRVIMLTGDHPRTASKIATEVGLADVDAGVATGAVLDDPEARAAAIDSTAVFARVAPRHKLELVTSLQAQGHVVAMTGDGVNDAPALRAADIGVAMGIAGSDVSKGAADMILVDDNFATVVAAVEEGRAIFRNIGSFLRYLLSSNAGEVLTMLLGVLFATALGLLEGDAEAVAPLLATQILWINLLTDTGPALAMGAERPDDDVMSGRPRALGQRLIDREMVATVGLLGFTMAVSTLAVLDAQLPGGLIEGDSDLTTARTAAFTTLVLAQLFNAFNTRSTERSAFVGLGSNPWLIGAVFGSLLLQVLVVHVGALNEAFDTTALSLGEWLVCAAAASAVLWVGEIQIVVRRQVTRLRTP